MSAPLRVLYKHDKNHAGWLQDVSGLFSFSSVASRMNMMNTCHNKQIVPWNIHNILSIVGIILVSSCKKVPKVLTYNAWTSSPLGNNINLINFFQKNRKWKKMLSYQNKDLFVWRHPFMFFGTSIISLANANGERPLSTALILGSFPGRDMIRLNRMYRISFFVFVILSMNCC